MRPARNFSYPRVFCVFFLLIISGYLAGCVAFFTSKIEKMGPRQLILEGKTRLKEGDLTKAERVFRKFTEKFPNSKMMDIATMGLADSLYRQGEDKYIEADLQYLNFIELYPAHPMVDRAYFYKGMSNYKQMEAYNRDQTNTREAVKNFSIIINEYPKSRYYKRAKKYLREGQIHLAKNLFYIGKYYFKVRAHQSTILRMRELLEKYPGFKSNDEALFLIGKSYFNEENFKEAAKVFAEFIRKYPKSEFRSEVIKRLRILRKYR